MDKRKEIAKLVIATIHGYGKVIQEDALRFWVDDLERFPFEEISAAFSQWRKRSRFPPVVADILEIINPEISPADEAQTVASLIIKAINDYGYTWQHWIPADRYTGGTWNSHALAELGPMACHVIMRWGGWGVIHDSYFSMDEGHFRAQIRDFIASQFRLAKAGALNYLPPIPDKKNNDMRIEKAKVQLLLAEAESKKDADLVNKIKLIANKAGLSL